MITAIPLKAASRKKRKFANMKIYFPVRVHEDHNEMTEECVTIKF
jgi:hypothetical protein